VQRGHISKQGSATARHVLGEAVHARMRSPERLAGHDGAPARRAVRPRPVDEPTGRDATEHLADGCVHQPRQGRDPPARLRAETASGQPEC
jgi:hypothetical protein